MGPEMKLDDLTSMPAGPTRLVNTSLPPDVELEAGWDACIATLGRPAEQKLIAR